MAQTEVGREVGGCPVVHYDHTVLGPVLSHLEALDEMRSLGPVFRSTHGVGFYAVTEAEAVRAVLQEPTIFSSSIVVPHEPDPAYMWIPEMLDPPIHTKWRQLLAPEFAPKVMERMEDRVRQRCVELLDEFADRGHCDFLRDFAWKFPTSIFLELMGLPISDLDQFLKWENEILHLPGDQDPTKERAMNAMMAVMGYFQGLIEQRRVEPADDLLSTALSWKIDGEPISEQDLLSFCLLMFMAGMDTVSIQLGYSIYHLATHEEDRRRIVDDPALIPSAVEELLRYYAFVCPGRKAMAPATVQGFEFQEGARVLVPLGAANRDPKAFERPDQFLIDRSPNNHVAFGLGPHRCLGSHLARRELRIALEEWHLRIPSYRLDPDVEIVEHGGMFGLDSLGIRWD